MRSYRTFFAIAILFFAAAVFRVAAQPTNPVTSTPVFVPDYTHANDPITPGTLAWDSTQKTLDCTNGQDFAKFTFYFTNTATMRPVEHIDNIDPATGRTNTVLVTNAPVPAQVTILNVHPSCGCTTAQLPPVPWQLPPGTNSSIGVSVNLQGKIGTLFKSVTINTDKGRLDLMVRINILPAPPAAPMSAEQRARGIAAASADRQAVFKGDCISCHAKNVQNKYGQQLYDEVCSVCHEANPRASMVPDLRNLKDPTSEEFWRAWITSGKPGTLMPAFATAQGGPLNDMQIASLAAYLNSLIPPKAPASAQQPK